MRKKNNVILQKKSVIITQVGYKYILFTQSLYTTEIVVKMKAFSGLAIIARRRLRTSMASPSLSDIILNDSLPKNIRYFKFISQFINAKHVFK
jgi:hypothetical protein